MKIIVTGSGGRLGAALVREYGRRFEVTGFDRSKLDLADSDQLRRALGETEFDVLINAAAFTNVDLAEKEKQQAFKVNTDGPRVLAELCHARNAKLIHVSTDYVFDGKKNEPYCEDDEANPIGVYGQTKRAGEEAVLSVSDQHLVVRVSWVFGPDRPSFVDQMIDRAVDHETIAAVADKVSTPTYTRDIAEMLLPAVAGGTDTRDSGVHVRAGATNLGYNGILHIANSGQCTWQEYAQEAVDCCHRAGIGLKARHVGAIKLSDMKTWIARRPVHTVLSTDKCKRLSGISPRPWREAVAEYVRDFITSKYRAPGAATRRM